MKIWFESHKILAQTQTLMFNYSVLRIFPLPAIDIVLVRLCTQLGGLQIPTIKSSIQRYYIVQFLLETLDVNEVWYKRIKQHNINVMNYRIYLYLSIRRQYPARERVVRSTDEVKHYADVSRKKIFLVKSKSLQFLLFKKINCR